MSTEIVAPMPGTIIDILVKEGEEVLEYQEVVILEAMKMENAIPTPEAGKVKEIKVKVDDKVSGSREHAQGAGRSRKSLFPAYMGV
jgi:biotin carboxyl carrier protein